MLKKGSEGKKEEGKTSIDLYVCNSSKGIKNIFKKVR